MTGPGATTTLPLQGLLVAEVGERIAAGACGSLLAQLGACVVVLEPPSGKTASAAGKWRRRASAVAGKLSLLVDEDDPGDRALREELMRHADVVLFSSDFAPGAPAWSREAGADEIARGQVLCDITAFGHSGPLAGRGGSEALVQALGGIVHTTGFAEGGPELVRTPILEMSTGLYAASAVLAALHVRRLRGAGQRIDMALMDAAVNALPNFFVLHYAGEPAERAGNRHPLYAPWASFRASDGHVLICSATADQFARICGLIGRPELVTDERFATLGARRRNVAEVERLIGEWTATRTVAECERLLASLGVPCGPVVDPAQLAGEPNLAWRHMFVRLPDPVSGGEAVVPSTPMRGNPVGGRPPARISAPGADRVEVSALLQARQVPPGPPRREAARPLTGAASPAVPARTARTDLPALQGLRVVEIGHYTVAPLASRQLGALGADVIKVEPPTGDAIRNAASARGEGFSHIFIMSNTDKRGLVLDLREAADRDRLHRLLAQSDILVENLRQGALAARGFGPDVLRARHPHLIYCAISGFGADSVYPGRPAYDTVIQAMSGLMGAVPGGGNPLKTGISASDMIGGLFGLLALLAGTELRDRTGIAVHFDISMQDASAWVTQMEWGGALAAPPVRVIACTDGHVVAEGDASAVVPAGQHWDGDRASLVAAVEAAGAAAAPVLTVREVAEHPQTLARELLLHRATTDGEEWAVLASPLRLCETPPKVGRVMSRLGEDDAEVIAAFGLEPPPRGEREAVAGAVAP